MDEHTKKAYFILLHKKDLEMSDNSNSVAVRQFMAIVRLETPVHVPANMFRTTALVAEERYCGRCCDVRVWDMWHGRHDGVNFCLGRCRACGLERTV